jgi:hypothetical protein
MKPCAKKTVRPNMPLELTPQAANKIGAILQAGFGSTAFPI